MGMGIKLTGNVSDMIEWLEGKRDARLELAESGRTSQVRERAANIAEGLNEAIEALRQWEPAAPPAAVPDGKAASRA